MAYTALMPSGIMALPLLTVPFVLESPRFHLASGRTRWRSLCYGRRVNEEGSMCRMKRWCR